MLTTVPVNKTIINYGLKFSYVINNKLNGCHMLLMELFVLTNQLSYIDDNNCEEI